MLSIEDRKKIKKLAKQYGAKKIILFGSSLKSDSESNDIDLAVEGVPANKFFEFYGILLLSLSKPVDVIDLSKKSRFTEFILRKGQVIYG